MSNDGFDFFLVLFIGALIGVGFCDIAGCNLPEGKQRQQGHDQGACDMHCGSHAEASRIGYTRLRCICSNRSIKMFEVTK